MNAAFTISFDDGSIQVEGCPRLISSGMGKEEVMALLSTHFRNLADMRTGYEWLYLQGLTFGDMPAVLGLCFYHDRLDRADWGITLPNAETEQGWPTRNECDREVAFMRGVLAKQSGRAFSSGVETYSWGMIWSSFDGKGFSAGSGIRYKTRPEETTRRGA